MNKFSFIKKIALPIACIIIGIVLAGFITSEYISDSEKMNWTSAEAVVVDLDSYRTSGGGHSSSRTVYKISYSYNVDGTEYTGLATSYSPMQLGKELQIKYNPSSPSESTALAKPDTQGLVIVLIFSVVLIAIGIMFTIIMWKSRFELMIIDEDKPYYHEPKGRTNWKAYLGLIPVAIFIIAGVLMYSQPFAQKDINQNDFVQIMSNNGYEVEESTDRLQTELGVGSLLKESYSVNKNDFRIDYCVINSNENAQLIYDSTTLYADVYVITNHNFVATEQGNMFYFKACNNNIYVYGGCTLENKDKMLELLKNMNYYHKE